MNVVQHGHWTPSALSPVSNHPPGLPIALELFDRVDEYSDEIRELIAEGDEADPEVASDTSIIIFCENFFAQFFRSFGVRLTGLDERARMQAARQRLGLSKKTHQAARSLIVQFEKLCDLWPDLQGRGYTISLSHRTEFHLTYLPTLFRRIGAWAEEADFPAIAERVDEAAGYYEDALEGFPNGE